jgi:hypothetical protein
MTVYRLAADHAHVSEFAFVRAADEQLFDGFDGNSMAQGWTPVPVGIADENDADARLGDHMLLGIIPTFSPHAVEALRDLLEPNGELLPIHYRSKEYFAYNVTTMVDALNEAASVVKYFSGGGVMWITEYVFHADVVQGKAIFKIPQLPMAHVFVTDAFVSRVRVAGLRGFTFTRLWTDTVA